MDMQNEKGNAIIWILIAVGLFAALGYAFSSTSRNSVSTMTGEEVKSKANESIAYMNEVKSAVRRLTLRGCDETEISFENSKFAGYTNTNAPSSNKCHVFDPSGGGLFYRENLSNNAAAPITITGDVAVQDIGTTEPELYFQLNEVDMNVCHKINESLGIIITPEDSIVDDIAVPTQFTGSYGAAGNVAGDEISEFAGQKSFCRKDSSGDYFYLTTLIAR